MPPGRHDQPEYFACERHAGLRNVQRIVTRQGWHGLQAWRQSNALEPDDDKRLQRPTRTTIAPPPPPPPPPYQPPTIVGESVVINQKFNKKHKPIGKATLSGYTITFSTDMDQTALANRANYQVALKVIKKVKVGKKKVPRTVLKPIGFSVATVTTNSVTLKLAGKQNSRRGGRSRSLPLHLPGWTTRPRCSWRTTGFSPFLRLARESRS